MRKYHSKSLLLFDVLRKDPREFYDRVDAVAQVSIERLCPHPCRWKPVSQEAVLEALGKFLSVDVEAILNERPLADVSGNISEQFMSLGESAPFGSFHNGDAALARLCYVVCRLIRPSVVLETGVAYGVTSAYILQALETNRYGTLYSVDLPPLGRESDDYIGKLIPSDLRGRWHFFRGSSKRVIPRLLPKIGRIDLFIHDSLHTRRNMKMEFARVWPRLRTGGMLISDDVEGNQAFEELAVRVKPALAFVFTEDKKSALCGIVVKSPDAHPGYGPDPHAIAGER